MIFFTKSILALVLVGLGMLNVLFMLEILGRAGEKRYDPKKLKLAHRLNGYVFVLLCLALSYLCVKIMRGMGGELSARATLHGLLAVAAFFLLGFKILVVRFYKKYYNAAFGMGLGVMLLMLTTTALSAGHYFAMRGVAFVQIASEKQTGALERGVGLFNGQGCADCHYADRVDRKIGPGLKGLFESDALPVSKWKANEENVRKQIKTPFRAMPAYPDLTEDQLGDLVAFLKTL